MDNLRRSASLVAFLGLIVAAPAAQSSWVQDGVLLCGTPQDQYAGGIVADGDGGAVIVWHDYRNNAPNITIYAQALDRFGTTAWGTNGLPICTAAGSVHNAPSVISDGAGGAVFAWNDSRGTSPNNIFVQRVSDSGAVQWATDGVALTTIGWTSGGGAIIPDGTGGAIVAFSQGLSYPDLYAQRIDGSGDILWTSGGAVVCSHTGDQRGPGIVADGAGGAIIAWQDNRAGSYSIYAQRVNGDGQREWSVSGVPVYTNGSSQFFGIVSDGAGGAIIVWSDYRNGNHDLYAQRIDATGATRWAANGVPVCLATGTQEAASAVSDGTGGVIVVWKDQRLANTNDVYAQRVNEAGTAVWAANGVALCTAAGSQGTPRVVADGAGGAVVTWHDERSGMYSTNIYTQRVDAAGVVLWTADGVVACGANSVQEFPVIAPDADGGAFIAWNDFRSAYNYDVYAQRVTSGGNVVVGVEDVAQPLSLSLLTYPNPFNPRINIAFTTAREERTQVRVYAVDGRLVAELCDRMLEPGPHDLSWTGLDDHGRVVPSGVYLVRLVAGENQTSSHITLVR